LHFERPVLRTCRDRPGDLLPREAAVERLRPGGQPAAIDLAAQQVPVELAQVALGGWVRAGEHCARLEGFHGRSETSRGRLVGSGRPEVSAKGPTDARED